MTQSTKLVRITLAAMVRHDYSEVLEVPADMTPAQLEALVNERLNSVPNNRWVADMDHFDPVLEYCQHEPVDPGALADDEVPVALSELARS